VRDLLGLVAELEREAALAAVILTGRGKAFSAGGDLESYLELYRNPARFRGFLADFARLNAAIEASAKIYLAAVNGFCVAGGLELMLACDLALAAEEARIGDGHLNFAQLPGAGGSQRLPRAIGVLRAKELILTGELLDGRAAAAIGLVNRAVPGERLMAEALAVAGRLAERSRVALGGAKYLVNAGLRTDLAAGLEIERGFVHNYATAEPDATEGLVAFKQKRKPRFGL